MKFARDMMAYPGLRQAAKSGGFVETTRSQCLDPADQRKVRRRWWLPGLASRMNSLRAMRWG